MPDDPSPPPDPPRDDAPDPTDQLDIEAALAEASGLSSKLSSEVGAPEAGGGGDAGANVQDVEAQLAEVEQLLTEVAGGETDESAEPAKESESEQGEVASDAPPEDKEIEPPAVTVAEPPPETPDVESGDDAPAIVAEGADASADVTPNEPVPESPVNVPMRWTLAARWRLIREVTTRWSRAMLESATRATLHVFDAVDPMFSRINLGARQVIGWVALAIFTAACSLTVYSFSS